MVDIHIGWCEWIRVDFNGMCSWKVANSCLKSSCPMSRGWMMSVFWVIQKNSRFVTLVALDILSWMKFGLVLMRCQ